jgi:hypothetical protein
MIKINKKMFTLGALIAFIAVAVTTGGVNAASTLFGEASIVPGGNPGTALQTVSDNDPGFGGASFNDANGILFSALSALSTDYNVTDDDCGGGSPRFQIKIDENDNNVDDGASDGSIWVYIGPSPSFTDCATGWQSSGNLVGNNDAGRWSSENVGGVNSGTYAQALAAAGTHKILGISLVIDSSWSAAATNGDGEQTILFDNTNINGNIYDYTLPTHTVTIAKYIEDVPATALNANSNSFPMQSSWNADNIGAGSGTYDLGPTGFNNPNPYRATTSEMTEGASYTTSEQTNGSVVGSSCQDGKPFALKGYTTSSVSLADAASKTPSLTVPNFTNLQNDAYVIVWNEDCTPAVTPSPSPSITQSPFAVPAECSQIAGLGAPIVGTSGADNINGTNGNDLIFALSGADRVDGRGGNDCIVAAGGADLVRAGNGDDVVLGGEGADDLRGENGTDSLYGEAGADLLRGGNGADTLDGGANQDSARGENGQDTCTAESENSCEL